MYVPNNRCSVKSDRKSGSLNFRVLVSPTPVRQILLSKVLLPCSAMLFCMLFCNVAWGAQESPANPFKNGWVLDTSSSSLTFQTIKNGSTLETNSFTSFEGAVDETGLASLRIQLDSVDTKVDLRNVRLRFLLFETYKFADAVVSANIDPAALSTLSEKSRIELPVEFELELHGIKQTLQAKTVVTQLVGNQVSVASAAPLSIETKLFDLDAGVKKLEESANVDIVPMGAVSFDLIFTISAEIPNGDVTVVAEAAQISTEIPAFKATAGELANELATDVTTEESTDEASVKIAANNAPAEQIAEQVEAVDLAEKVPAVVLVEAQAVGLDSAPDSTPYISPYSTTESEALVEVESEPESVILVEAGDLTVEQCAQRFELLSQTGGIFFKISSARLDPKSVGALTTIIDVVNRCPQVNLIVGGHTDSIGTRKSNQRLSELRAKSVSEYMVKNKVDPKRLSTVGFGETKPLVPNNTRRNRERNRRIEFTIAN